MTFTDLVPGKSVWVFIKPIWNCFIKMKVGEEMQVEDTGKLCYNLNGSKAGYDLEITIRETNFKDYTIKSKKP